MAAEFCLEQASVFLSTGKEEFAKSFEDLASLASRRLWHQLSISLEKILASPEVQGLLLAIHERFLEPISRDLDQIKYVGISNYIVNHANLDTAAQIGFLRTLVSKPSVIADKQALVLANSALATALLQSLSSSSSSSSSKVSDDSPSSSSSSSSSSSPSSSSSSSTSSTSDSTQLSDDVAVDARAEVKALIQKIKKDHSKLRGATKSVDAAFYKLLADFHLINGPPEAFLENGLMYLAFQETSEMPLEERRQFAIDLSLASLCGEKTYNFGQLLSHPILDVLSATPDSWLVSLLDAFNRGDIESFNKISSQFEAQMATHPSLVLNAALLRRKIRILGLMELIFHRDRDHRVLSFQEVADATELPVSEVELLITKALSLQLIRGTIDQVDQTINVTWVQPRVLTIDQIQAMKSRLDDWSLRVYQTLLSLESHSGDLIN